MADANTTDTARFIVSVGKTIIQTEEQALSVYYQMQTFPELKRLFSLHSQEITKALQTKDTQTLINVIQKVQSDFARTTAELPDQIQQNTDKLIKDAQLSPDELSKRVTSAQEALDKVQKTADSVYTAKRKQNKEFIEKLVKNYSRLSPSESAAIADALITAAETSPTEAPQQLIQNAAKSIPQMPQETVRTLQKQRDVATGISRVQFNNKTSLEQQLIQAILDSPEPAVTIQAIQTYENSSMEIPVLIKNAQLLAEASLSSKNFSSQTAIDYSGFFSNISKHGSLAEKTLAPLADTIFSLFPQKTQEAAVLKILGASWHKEVSNNTFVQQTLGSLFQSGPVQQAIQHGNALFQGGGKNTVFTGTQSFFVDIFVTVFHPQVSEIYLKLAAVNNMQMSTSASAYYAGWLAGQGATAVAKKGTKIVAEKATGTAIGKILGGLLGSEGGPVGSFIGGLVFDKILGGLWNGTKKVFNLFTLGWLGNLISGNYQSTPLGKDPIFIGSALLIGIIATFFVLPFFPLTLIGNAPFQTTVQDNAFLQGLGGEDAGLDTGSKYISLSKTPSQSSFTNDATTVTYTIKIGATSEPITLTSVSDSFVVFAKTGSPSVAAPTLSTPTTIEPGSPYTTTFSIPITAQMRDAIITNTLSVTADVGSHKGETKTTTATVTVGTPPTGCFAAKDSGPSQNCNSGVSPSPWNAKDWGTVVGAIAQLAKSPAYMSLICAAGEVPVYRVVTTYGGGCFSGGGIFIYNGGVSSGGSAIYTFAHESGHLLNSRTTLFTKFLSEGISSPAKEGLLPTYPNTKTPSEDFAETIGMYVGHSFYYPPKWLTFPNYPSSYPLHYNFAKELFGGIQY